MGAAVVNSCGGMFNIRRLQSPLSNNMSGILVNLYVSTKYRQYNLDVSGGTDVWWYLVVCYWLMVPLDLFDHYGFKLAHHK